MNTSGAIKWIKTSFLAAIGGGITAALAASMDPNKWKFPQDVGSGKLLPFFFTGAALAFGGMLLHSPLGQSAMSAYKDAQAQLEQSKADIEKAKAELRPPEKKEPGK